MDDDFSVLAHPVPRTAWPDEDRAAAGIIKPAKAASARPANARSAPRSEDGGNETPGHPADVTPIEVAPFAPGTQWADGGDGTTFHETRRPRQAKPAMKVDAGWRRAAIAQWNNDPALRDEFGGEFSTFIFARLGEIGGDLRAGDITDAMISEYIATRPGVSFDDVRAATDVWHSNNELRSRYTDLAGFAFAMFELDTVSKKGFLR